MYSTSDFKTGLTITFDGNIYQIMEFLHVKPGKGSAFVRTKLRNLRTDGVIDHTFQAGAKVGRAQIDKIKMSYLYANGSQHVFMNNETFDQVEFDAKDIENQLNYLTEGMLVEVIYYNGSEVLGIDVPEKVVLEVVDTPPGVKGDTKSNATKDATLETGLIIKVPLFIDNGERIIVSTYDGSYVSREK